jgi:hypothetical protein
MKYDPLAVKLRGCEVNSQGSVNAFFAVLAFVIGVAILVGLAFVIGVVKPTSELAPEGSTFELSGNPTPVSFSRVPSFTRLIRQTGLSQETYWSGYRRMP